MSGVICGRGVPARVKGKVYTVALRPAMLYGLETVALTKRQEAEFEVAELSGYGGGRVEDVTIFISSDKKGEDQE